ncbi:hypothetical protein BD770DRAFT_389380 [Pilaira anomala]|nr:hypothetical protein BD770DRAFT_389380 [Pilaira anomala]
MKDTVVDLEDLVSLTTPEYSPRVATSLVQVNDVEDNTSVNNVNNLKSMESLISPSTDTNTDQTIESPVQRLNLESPVPVPKPNPESPTLESKPNATDLTDTLNNSSSETEKKTMKPIRLRVKLADDSFSELIVKDGDDIQSVVSTFCKENGLESSEPELYKKAVEKKTKMILKRRKKSKKPIN